MFRFGFLIVTVFFCCACNTGNNETPSGGGCTYAYDTSGATIIAIDSVAADQFDLVAVVNRQGLHQPDTVNFYRLNNRYCTGKDISSRNIRVNDTVCFITGTIISGSCNPAINRMDLQRFITRNK